MFLCSNPSFPPLSLCPILTFYNLETYILKNREIDCVTVVGRISSMGNVLMICRVLGFICRGASISIPPILGYESLLEYGWFQAYSVKIFKME